MLKISNKVWKYSFQKQASVTFIIKDSERLSQPKNLNQISHDITASIFETYPREWLQPFYPDVVTPDAPQWQQMTGDINWYVPSNVEPEEVWPYIQNEIKDMALLGIKIEAQPVRQKSRMLDPTGYKIVLRVTENETSGFNKLRELNVANSVAAAVLQLLQMSDEETIQSPFGPLTVPTEATGEMPAQEMLRRIKQSYGRIQSATRPEESGPLLGEEPNPYEIETPFSLQEKERDQEINPQMQGRWRTPGIGEEKIWRVLNELESMALQAMQLQLNKDKPAIIRWY